MLVICTATAPDGRQTHHLVRAETGSDAYRRLNPLLTPGSELDTCGLEYWLATRDPVPEDLRPLDEPTAAELAAIEGAGGRLIPSSTPRPNGAVHSDRDRSAS